MIGTLVTVALILWVLSRGRLWKKIFNLRRELRAALRQRSFFQYYVSIRWREIAGFIGFSLASFSVATSDEMGYLGLHQGAVWLLYLLMAGVVLYALYLLLDTFRLRRRFRRLLMLADC
jgi:uncharacterized membrane protein